MLEFAVWQRCCEVCRQTAVRLPNRRATADELLLQPSRPWPPRPWPVLTVVLSPALSLFTTLSSTAACFALKLCTPTHAFASQLQTNSTQRASTDAGVNHLSFRMTYFHTTNTHTRTHARTHTHTRLTALCPGLPRWAGSRKVKPIWILLKQETVSGSGISWAICKSAPRSRQITMQVPHHSVFLQAGCPSCHPTNSVKALKATIFSHN